MRHNPRVNERLVRLADAIITAAKVCPPNRCGYTLAGVDTRLELKNEQGQLAGSIGWSPEDGFELQADLEYWGQYFPASQWYPAEQQMIPVARVYLTAYKIQEVADKIAEYGFIL